MARSKRYKSSYMNPKKVADIARNVLKKNSETKTTVQGGNYTLSSSNHMDSTNKIDLFAVGQGDGQNQRDGHQIRVTAYDTILTFVLNESVVSSAANLPLLVRVIEYTPRGNQSLDLSLTNIYDQPDLDDFNIHRDVLMPLSITGGTGGPTATYRSRKFFKRPLHVQYDSSTSDDIVKNERKIYFCFNVDGLKSIAVGNNIGLVWRSRIKFKDM